MRPSIITTLCLFGSAIAAPVSLVPRDSMIIEISLRSVSASLQNLVTLIQGLETHKGPNLNQHISMITHHGQELSSVMKKGANDIRRGPDATLFEATSLLGPVQQLEYATSKAVDAWIASRKTIIDSGGKYAVREILTSQQKDVDEFTQAMIKKLPFAAQYIGQTYATNVRRSIDRGISYFK
jgi:hypothetical protein